DGERITFTSANPFSYYHVITDLENQEPQQVYGILRFPEGSDPKNLPLIVGINGSKNWADHHYEYMDMYREMGFATFEQYSFNSRNVNSTVGEQVSVTTAMMILDAYRALDVLAQDPRIDVKRAAITGWSLGGGVTLFSAWQPLIDAIKPDHLFSAHLSFYPPCMFDMELIEFSEAPIHILTGELDDWVPADACEDLAADLMAEGVNIGITVYPNAHHGFDREGPLSVEEKGYTASGCHFRMREDGALLMNFLNIPMITPFRQKIALAFCAGRGPTIGGNPEARKASFEFAKEFMKEHLLSAE
ncbi:MAG: dienelactone hydrolase family protein, partial [Candidatus Marinimicrobia bacterium]|nr:dienelactone hydrolase family protein [Candidatus Neomarinimicrobiota bacterium]MDP6230175.1 dienelactone hydrolase family protein [Candidatus Neomarinimicrobiota bacterium]MDP7095531.1 dienelactone hydrolase family protein [Candidatus Neomarinimicrobiota bacterium]MDP7165379.1 dienelactone hydrolase family protein [Candidatus Neomarinimicrobiota bacterium]